MPRKKSPDARDEVMSARFSKTEAEAIDEARGTVDRSVWLYRAALAALNGNSGIPEPGRAPSAASRQPAVKTAGKAAETAGTGAAGTAAADPAPERKTRAKGPCEHRVKPGSYCKRCDRMI